MAPPFCRCGDDNGFSTQSARRTDNLKIEGKGASTNSPVTVQSSYGPECDRMQESEEKPVENAPGASDSPRTSGKDHYNFTKINFSPKIALLSTHIPLETRKSRDQEFPKPRSSTPKTPISTNSFFIPTPWYPARRPRGLAMELSRESSNQRNFGPKESFVIHLFAQPENHEENVTVEKKTQSRNEDEKHAKGPRDHSSSSSLVVRLRRCWLREMEQVGRCCSSV
ncbi:hypothetical protein WN48_01373 [Eufriesea mexicana]|uniref:Uncharacterized protein n=1 Tax=Eufriesea mexicana TaxID=516756 RepID=A0A310SUB0_9HYME|nr:hypothetical protein WN48_01373 [Eufriesea mexicana]